MSRRILVVGGVAAGASAATKARRTDERAEIIVFERGGYVSFANCGLPYYISRDISDRSRLIVVTPERFRDRYRIDVRLGHEVTAIDPAGRTVAVRELSSERVYSERYDELILTPGARPIVPKLPMVDAPNVFTMRTIPDMDRVDAYIRDAAPRRATVIGAGFIGLEMAEALLARGMEVTLVEKLPQVLPPLDPEMAAPVADHLRMAGVMLMLGDGVRTFDGNGRVSTVILESGRAVATDMVILSIGVRPDTTLAEAAGLTLGPTGAIAVDARMRTSDPHIWAAGDAVESTHLVTGRPTWIPLAGPANRQGRAAGCNAAGGDMRFRGVLGTAIVRFRRIVAAVTGLNERAARREGYDVASATVHAGHHAGYYPGAEPLTVKLLYERRSGRLLGAQVIGHAGVDKRIDVLATATAAGMTADEVAELDLAYAPPFGSARDPVHMAGFVAQNQLAGVVESITGDELAGMLSAGRSVQLVDVRTPEEYARAHLPGAKLLPLDQLRERIGELDPHRPVIVYCHVGFRGYLACRILMHHGFRARNLSGGIASWRFETIGPDSVSEEVDYRRDLSPA